jgi:hypothetical protein
MPQRFELTELSTGHIGGVPVAIAVARDKRVVGFVASFDGDGLMETREDCLNAARSHLRRLDKKSSGVQDSSTGLEQSGSSQGS